MVSGQVNSLMKVIHVAAYHPAQDVRVFHKECRSLARAGYDVHLMIPQPPAEEIDGVTFHPIEPPKYSHLSYWFWTIGGALYRIYRQVKALDGDLYHFHEAELIYVGLLLKLNGKKVIFDSHEDYPRQALYLDDKRLQRKIFARFMCFYLTILIFLARLTFDGFVATSPAIAKRYPKQKTVHAYNFARLEEFSIDNLSISPYQDRPNHVIFVGGINDFRGIRETVRAMSYLPDHFQAKFVLIGSFSTSNIQKNIENQPGWERVEFLGWQDRDSIAEHLAKARIGIVPFLYHPHHKVAIPNKLFEYMGGGLPVISSDFKHWQQVLGHYGDVPVWVNPHQPQEIATAIRYLLENPKEAERRAVLGREAIEKCCNWEQEVDKLVGLYRVLANKIKFNDKESP